MPSTQVAPRVYVSLKHGLRRLRRLPHYYYDFRHAVRGTTSLLALPSEIRQLVWEYIFADMRFRPVEPGTAKGHHLSLLLLCQRSYGEIKDAMLRSATFILCTEPHLLLLHQRQYVFESLRHVEVSMNILPGSITPEGRYWAVYNERASDLAWKACFLSALPNLQSVTINAESLVSNTGSAHVNLNNGSITSNSSDYMHRIVQRTENANPHAPTTAVSRKYFPGERWRAEAVKAGRTRIKWMLIVPFLLNYGSQTSRRVGVWPWRYQRFNIWEDDGLVSGKMDFEERMLRFQVCEWKYEFAQLL